MAARARWKEQIRLALVSIPVEIHAATRSGAAIRFRQIREPSGKPVKYEKVVPAGELLERAVSAELKGFGFAILRLPGFWPGARQLASRLQNKRNIIPIKYQKYHIPRMIRRLIVPE